MGADGPSQGSARRGERLSVFGVIPAGGAGTRLWPRSRRSSPKHALALGPGGAPLLAAAYERLAPLVDEVCILTESAQVDLVRSLLPGLDPTTVIVEPEPRGTAAALGLAAMTVAERDADAIMVSTAADHVISETDEFSRAVRLAIGVAGSRDSLVAIGLEPRFPATAYGYIRTRPSLDEDVREVDEFIEKPDRVRAEEFLQQGGYLWNLSMFAWRANVFIEELQRVAPAHYEGLRQVMHARARGDDEGAAAAYGRLPAEAVDYAVLEKTSRLLVVVARFDWTDVGSWSEIYLLKPRDAQGNAVEGDAVLLDTSRSLIFSPTRLVAGIGLEGLAVIDTEDAILVCPLDRAQDVKKLVDELRRTGRIRYL